MAEVDRGRKFQKPGTQYIAQLCRCYADSPKALSLLSHVTIHARHERTYVSDARKDHYTLFLSRRGRLTYSRSMTARHSNICPGNLACHTTRRVYYYIYIPTRGEGFSFKLTGAGAHLYERDELSFGLWRKSKVTCIDMHCTQSSLPCNESVGKQGPR